METNKKNNKNDKSGILKKVRATDTAKNISPSSITASN
jgi:hypothetical protein